MADSHPLSPKVNFHISKNWLEPEVIVQTVAAVAVVASVVFTAVQIRNATNATNAQNIYAAEKDFSALFAGAGKHQEFQHCFAESANPPSGCISRDARQIFYEMLQHYRLLGIMASKNAIPGEYYNFRLEGFCPYARSRAGRAEFAELLKADKLDKGLWSDLTRTCKL